MAGLKLEVEYVAPRGRCRDCKREFEVRNYELLCPACGSLVTDRISGDELEFIYLEIEELEIKKTETEKVYSAEPKLQYAAPAWVEVKTG